jgi:hypothetical protein
MNILPSLLTATVLLVLNGCTASNGPCAADAFDKNRNFQRTSDCDTKPYQMNNKIIVGSRQDDARVVYSTGKILKTWIAPYHQGGTLIASHDIYVVVEKPGFLAGESVGRNSGDPSGAVTPTGDFPFVYRDNELDRTTRDERFTNENIKRYNNNIYTNKQSRNIPAKSRSNKANAVYDEKIYQFLGGN